MESPSSAHLQSSTPRAARVQRRARAWLWGSAGVSRRVCAHLRCLATTPQGVLGTAPRHPHRPAPRAPACHAQLRAAGSPTSTRSGPPAPQITPCRRSGSRRRAGTAGQRPRTMPRRYSATPASRCRLLCGPPLRPRGSGRKPRKSPHQPLGTASPTRTAGRGPTVPKAEPRSCGEGRRWSNASAACPRRPVTAAARPRNLRCRAAGGADPATAPARLPAPCWGSVRTPAPKPATRRRGGRCNRRPLPTSKTDRNTSVAEASTERRRGQCSSANAAPLRKRSRGRCWNRRLAKLPTPSERSHSGVRSDTWPGCTHARTARQRMEPGGARCGPTAAAAPPDARPRPRALVLLARALARPPAPAVRALLRRWRLPSASSASCA
mmetsp:Transcript_38608/g.124079  ORF Transcript_38608/g.124079 Transcript_38608/m.124079 type:complete len:381 (-) Transcript_38608:62-1204(-)